MAQQTINVGTVPNDPTADPLRTAFTKANANFTELYSGYAPLASPVFTGDPRSNATLAPSDSDTSLATTAWVKAALAAVGSFTTGDAKITLKTVADAGWLMMIDQTIGDVGSNAGQVSATYQALFTVLFNNISDANAPVLSSAGSVVTRASQINAATAWANKCQVKLLWSLGRSIAIAGPGGGALTARALGANAGAETETQTLDTMVTHDHERTMQNISPAENSLVYTTPGTAYDVVRYATIRGGGLPLNILDPTVYWNVMIKL